MDVKPRSRNRMPALLLLGCFLIGLAIGFFVQNILSGGLIGLGSGFVVMAVSRFILFRKQE